MKISKKKWKINENLQSFLDKYNRIGYTILNNEIGSSYTIHSSV